MFRVLSWIVLPAAVWTGLASGIPRAEAADPPPPRSSSPVGIQAIYTAEPAAPAAAPAARAVAPAPSRPSSGGGGGAPAASGAASAAGGSVAGDSASASDGGNVQIEGNTEINATAFGTDSRAVGGGNASCAHVGSIGGGKC